ncbi:hypothetical protein B0H10DRAFT_2213291 [Mycena sp. CBHHK59/15]|nr:hypothetical protein B0H10DRAFT_2213291 [Mycena sp. CBHHK59/15]
MSQLQSLILLVFLSLIPYNALRYTILGIGATIAMVYAVHTKRPSTLLRQLEDTIQEIEKLIHSAKLQCARDQFNLAAEVDRIKLSVSEIRCCILESEHITWKKYRLLSKRILECKQDVRKIRITVQLTVEAERQRKYTEDIHETQTILTTIRGAILEEIALSRKNPGISHSTSSSNCMMAFLPVVRQKWLCAPWSVSSDSIIARKWLRMSSGKRAAKSLYMRAHLHSQGGTQKWEWDWRSGSVHCDAPRMEDDESDCQMLFDRKFALLDVGDVHGS